MRRHAPTAPYPRERPGTHCTGGWVGLTAGLDWCGKSRPTGIRSQDRPAPRQSLYRLSYRAHIYNPNLVNNTGWEQQYEINLGVRNSRSQFGKKKEDCFEPVRNVPTPFYPQSNPNFCLPLFNSFVKRKLFLGIKIFGGDICLICPPHLPKLRP